MSARQCLGAVRGWLAASRRRCSSTGKRVPPLLTVEARSDHEAPSHSRTGASLVQAAQAAQLPTAPPESDADRLHAWLLTQLIMAQHAHRALCQRALARFLGASREEAEEASLLALRAAALACMDSLWADFLKVERGKMFAHGAGGIHADRELARDRPLPQLYQACPTTQNMETLAAAAMVRAFSRRDPWDEFKLETSALFMLLLQGALGCGHSSSWLEAR